MDIKGIFNIWNLEKLAGIGGRGPVRALLHTHSKIHFWWLTELDAKITPIYSHNGKDLITTKEMEEITQSTDATT